MQGTDFGLQLSNPSTHAHIKLESTLIGHCSSLTKKQLLIEILEVIGFYLLKLILCVSLLVDLLAGYFLLVNKFNLDGWEILHIIIGCYIALAVIWFWETLNGLIE